MSRVSELQEKYLHAVASADAGLALDLIERELAQGVAATEIIRNVIIPTQKHVGAQWLSGAWDVADEHAATGVSEQVLGLLSPRRARSPERKQVVLACPENEWHSLPARLAASLGSRADLDIITLGSSLPADQLKRALLGREPDALALSCTLPANLLSAEASIRAATEVGVPVVVGGAAWGSGQRRARALGAAMHLEDASALSAALESLPEAEAPPEARIIEAALLERAPTELLNSALERQESENAWMARMSLWQRDRTLEDLRWMSRHAAAAVACDDVGITIELLEWLLTLLEHRGVPSEAILDSASYLAEALEADAPDGAHMLTQARAAVDARIAGGAA